MISARAALDEITARLKAAGIEEPRREARLLLQAALGLDRAGLLLRESVDPAAYEDFARRRAAHEPLAYISGRREFWGLAFEVSPATLIPRPDTETLVEAVLESGHVPQRVLDLGTGTGCLLLAVLHEFPQAFGVGVDLNPAAAALAARNAGRLGFSHRAVFCAGSWAEALETRFDLVLSNPPYIESADIGALDRDVAAYEPATALDGGADGLTAYRAIISALPGILVPGGLAVLELGIGQGPAVAELAAAHGFAAAAQKTDLAGIPRAFVLKYLA